MKLDMKICMIISKIEPTKTGVYVGGAVNVLLTLIKYLERHGLSISVLTSLCENKLPLFQEYTPEGAKFTVLKNNGRPQSVMFGLVFVVKAIQWALIRKRNSFDIIHGHSGYAIYAWITYLIARIIGCKCVHTVYCPVQTQGTINNNKGFVLKGALAKYALDKMDQIVAMSNNVAESLCETGIDKKRIVVVATAVDTAKYRPKNSCDEIRNILEVSNQDLLILYVGNLMKSKGLDILVEAFSIVHYEIPNAKLVLTLELKHKEFGERKKALKNRIRELGLEENIVELGMIDYMPKLISTVNIVVSPYLDTQGPSDYPLSIMEAMASGKCVVGTSVGGMPELIDNGLNGRLVSPGNIQGLAETLISLLNDPGERRKLGMEALRKTLKLNTPARMVEGQMKIYSKVMANDKGERW